MNPFGKDITDLKEADIDGLFHNEIPEGIDIDYKRDLPKLNETKSKTDFLVDVASFANAMGGCLVYGIKDKEGVPDELSGVDDVNFESLKQRMESIARAHIRPRLAPSIRFADVAVQGKRVVVVQIFKSWRSPHMVEFPRKRFDVRSSAGNNVSMDIEDLRAAFLGAAGIESRIKEFRFERLSNIVSGETLFPLNPGPAVVLHAIPLSRLDESNRFDIEQLKEIRQIFNQSSNFAVGDDRINLDGLALAEGAQPSARRSCAQVFQNGTIEFVTTWTTNDDGALHMPSVESFLVGWVRLTFDVYERMAVEPPATLMISLLGVKDRHLFYPQMGMTVFAPEDHSFDRDQLILDAVVLDSFGDPKEAIRNSVDRIWQAGGFERSPTLDGTS